MKNEDSEREAGDGEGGDKVAQIACLLQTVTRVIDNVAAAPAAAACCCCCCRRRRRQLFIPEAEAPRDEKVSSYLTLEIL